MEERPVVDPKRTGVKAIGGEWTEPPLFLVEGRWYGPRGYMVRRNDEKGFAGFLIACPGCGQVGSARDGAKWSVAGGNIDDVSTLTLRPSILKHCCGWHGYLTKGVFDSC